MDADVKQGKEAATVWKNHFEKILIAESTT